MAKISFCFAGRRSGLAAGRSQDLDRKYAVPQLGGADLHPAEAGRRRVCAGQ